MATDPDELQAALQATRAQLAAAVADRDRLRRDLESDPDLPLALAQVELDLDAAKGREQELVNAVKRARSGRAAATPRVRPQPALVAVAEPGVKPAPNLSGGGPAQASRAGPSLIGELLEVPGAGLWRRMSLLLAFGVIAALFAAWKLEDGWLVLQGVALVIWVARLIWRGRE